MADQLLEIGEPEGPCDDETWTVLGKTVTKEEYNAFKASLDLSSHFEDETYPPFTNHPEDHGTLSWCSFVTAWELLPCLISFNIFWGIGGHGAIWTATDKAGAKYKINEFHHRFGGGSRNSISKSSFDT